MEEGPFQKLENAGKFYFRWLENSVFEIGKAISISTIFNHLKRKTKSILRHKHTGKCYAVKISKREMNGHEGMRDDEIQILIKFGQHPNIITVKVGP